MRANFDETISETSIIEASYHVFKLDVKTFLISSSLMDKKLSAVRKILEKVCR